ncbi:MAG: bifunctional demethylmenaquinone methyltransferase/2-methoxy-6-polyprenyl-1,4-benzoquinol methylase UbiE [Vampirovibrionales bacterium]|nr:bifunctional demethylmenaquinone methyltransferase/2-methoxy-6-polyprenyl-1,4-benzoquinol methylase UbiE [Vampirovibrionales bacterium]
MSPLPPNAVSDLSSVTPSGQAALPEEKAADVQAMFDRIARTYDLLNDCISFGMHRQWKRRAIQRLQLPKGQDNIHVLDVCTGTGDLAGYFLESFEKSESLLSRITGLDFSQEMLAIARKRFPQSQFPAISFEQGDAMALPYADNTFDAAIISFGLRNIVDIPKAIAEMTRVVKPGAWVLNLDTSPTPKLPGYWLYFKTVMPIIGRLLSMDPKAYAYLSQSTEKFLSPAALVSVFQQAGLRQVACENLMFASVSMQWGQKPV